MTTSSYNYNEDFYAWSLSTAKMIRQGRFSEIDIEHTAEEIESMGRSDKNQLINRLAVLIAHILKWQMQPNRRGRSWALTIKEQRMRITRLLNMSPSLKYELDQALGDAYEQAVVIAEKETGLDESSFLKQCPFTLDDCLNNVFFPD